MNKHLKILIFLLIFVLSPIIVQNTLAQTPPPAENVVPIDGGLGFLLAAGIAYAAKKIYNNRDQEI